jgi:ribosome-binding protein aMBF1 (putative translation factor)
MQPDVRIDIYVHEAWSLRFAIARVQDMANLKRPLDRKALDALTLGTEQARAAYQEQRLTLEVGRTIRHARKHAELTQTELAQRAGIDQGDLSRLETGQGVRGATIAIVERVAQALGREVVIQFVDPATKREHAERSIEERDAVGSA